MKKYTQLTSEQRYQISGLKKAGWKQTQIAVEVGVDKSTISRELKRNKGERGWRPLQAQRFRDERRRGCINGKQFSSEEWAEVDRLIREDLSPEQAANRLEMEGRLQISHEASSTSLASSRRSDNSLLFSPRKRSKSSRCTGVTDFYSHTGRPSIAPEPMISMLIIGYSLGIRSERRLCEEVHLNLA